MKIRKSTGKVVDENYFENIDSEEKAYLLGIFFCGALLRPNKSSIYFKIRLDDREILDLISDKLCKENKVFIANHKHFKNGTVAKLTISSQKIKNDLIKLGLTESKTFSKYPNLSKDLLPHFVRGVFDKFGYFDFSKNQTNNSPYRIIYLSENENNLIFLSNLLTSIDINHNLKNRIEIASKENCLKFFDYIYKDANYKLARKYNRYQDFIKAIDTFTDLEMEDIIRDIDVVYYFNKGLSAKRTAEKINSNKKMVLDIYKKLGLNGAERFKANKEINKLRKSVSTLIRFGLKRNLSSKNGKSCSKYLPYTFTKLKKHIESLWEPWMNWSNFGQYKPKLWNDNDPSTWVWNLDHIIPHSLFNYTSMEDEDFKKCWALENLRPLNAKQNVIDGVKRIRHIK